MGASAAGVIAGMLCLMVCCAPATPEEQVLRRFFEASRALDRTLLDRLATVAFNPRTDGSIQTFTVTDRGAEQRHPLAETERGDALRSFVAGTGRDVDLAGLSVEMIARQVTVHADVRAPDGRIAPGVLLITLERAVGRRSDATVEGQWIVTRLQRVPDARISRAASSAPPR